MFLTVISLASTTLTFFTKIYILDIYYTFVITQSEYETFRNNINALMQEYRGKFPVPAITDSKEYEATYRKRLLGMSMEIRFMIDTASEILVDDATHHRAGKDKRAEGHP